ncbi:MAG: GIY-YIG nuclease family protein [Chloroflexota bacterium]|nr:GIY-YIG nuclease family protein [Chloroflexota bacterium]
MHYIYLLFRSDNKKTYIGYTDNLQRRLKEHKAKRPELIYYEAYRDKRDAQEREKKLKQRGQTIRRLKERLKHSLL